MIVLLNKYSNDGKGLQKWEKFRPEIEGKYIRDNYTLVSDFKNFKKRLSWEFSRGERLVVAAGGDGTINFLLNEVMKMRREVRNQVVMGAIGLGSSNDFHKPFSDARFLDGKIPFRLDHKKAVDHNVGQVDYEDENGRWQRKYFVINCSVGIIAQANYLFNSKERVVKWLKSKWVAGTIWYAALKTLFAARNVPAEITVGDESYSTEVTSLSVVINPHVSGNFSYDFRISPQSDFLGVALCERMGIVCRMKTIMSLTRGKFIGLPKTRAWTASRVEVHPHSLTPLELDGEVRLARKIRIKLLRRVLKVSR